MKRARITPELLDNAAHLRRELELLELRLRREILSTRSERGVAGRSDEFAGLIISDEEIDRYLQEAEGRGNAAPPDLAALDEEIAAGARALDRDRKEAVAAGRLLRLEHVREAFALAPDEQHALVACLAPELDVRFERYFAYLQNDVSRRRPCVQLLGKLFMGGAPGVEALRRFVAARDSLVDQRLLELVKRDDAGLAARELKGCDGLVQFVLEGAPTDPELRGIGAWRSGRPLPQEASYWRHHRELLGRLLALAARDGVLPHAWVRGPRGGGKEDLVLALAHGLTAEVLECSAGDVLGHAGDLGEWLGAVERDLRLRTAFLWIRHGEGLLEPPELQSGGVRALGTFLRRHPWLNVLVTAERGPRELRDVLGEALLELEIPPAGAAERVELWREALGTETAAGHPELLDDLAAKFRFGPGSIRAALRLVEWDDPREDGVARPGLLADRVHRACRAESTPTLDAFAQKLAPRYGWEDLVLPPDVLDQLREIRNCVRHRSRVHGEWGFESKFSLGKGLHVLFSGPSGTGKTMATEVLARDLGLDVYKIDLSSVVSKYIGETEKNLARIFQEAGSASCILLFDEADALFGKRSEVKDSHDRYANIEIDFLLQRMEEYEGAVLLTTNMAKNLDPAFTRRIQFTVEFPVPDERHRELLWSRVFPAATPLSDDVDRGFLARRFKLSGANIKNIALNSAFLAAANGGAVDMAHVVTALRREYRKLGKLASPSEFGAYSHLVQDDPGRSGEG